MARFDSVKGQALMTVETKDDEITFIFGDNRYLFVATSGNDKLNVTSLPE